MELSKQWHVWLQRFTYFAEGKANLQNPARKGSELFYRASSAVQDILENLITVPLEGQANDVYQQKIPLYTGKESIIVASTLYLQ